MITVASKLITVLVFTFISLHCWLFDLSPKITSFVVQVFRIFSFFAVFRPILTVFTQTWRLVRLKSHVSEHNMNTAFDPSHLSERGVEGLPGHFVFGH